MSKECSTINFSQKHNVCFTEYRWGSNISQWFLLCQYSIVPAFAFTDYKGQGQTLNWVIVDINKPATGSINCNQFSPYDVLTPSWGTDPKKVLLLRSFDMQLFTQGMDPDLAEEDPPRATEWGTKVRVWNGKHDATLKLAIRKMFLKVNPSLHCPPKASRLRKKCL